MMDQLETLGNSQIIFVALCFLLQVHSIAAPFTQNSKLCNYAKPKNHFPEPNRHILTFLHPIVMCTYYAPLEMLLPTLIWNSKVCNCAKPKPFS